MTRWIQGEDLTHRCHACGRRFHDADDSHVEHALECWAPRPAPAEQLCMGIDLTSRQVRR